MKTYKESFFYEQRLKKGLSRRLLIFSVGKNLLMLLAIAGFIFSCLDFPNSYIYQRILSGEYSIFPNSKHERGFLNTIGEWMVSIGKIIYHLASEYKFNLYFKGLVIASFLYIILRRWKNKFEQNFEITLKQIQSDKDVFIQRFLEILGKDFSQSLIGFLKQKYKVEKKNEKNLKEAKEKLLKEIKDLKIKLQKEEELKNIFFNFTEEIMRFQWCEVCYNEDEIELIQKNSEGFDEKKIQEGLKDTVSQKKKNKKN